jgi:OOP family OmpA-OmpF porin
MKKLIALVMATLALTSLQADPWEGFYVEGHGGANFVHAGKRSGLRHDFDTGYYVGGALGYRLCSGFRFEGEVTYRHNKIHRVRFDDVTDVTDSIRVRGRGHLTSVSYMANLLYEIDTSCWDCCWSCGEIVPYFGAGIGYSQQRFRFCSRDPLVRDRFNDRENGFAWQIIAGLGYEFSPCADISIEYRFHKGHAERIYNHGVGVAAKYHF